MCGTVLIVEDDSIIALELQFILADAGAEVVGPACSVDEALDLVEDGRPSAAVLDVRLAGEDISPVASALHRRHIPFVFYSGQVETDATMRGWPGASYVAKPAPSRVLVAAIRDLAKGKVPH
jgi:DNA-binding response OmpR family regulator